MQAINNKLILYLFILLNIINPAFADYINIYGVDIEIENIIKDKLETTQADFNKYPDYYKKDVKNILTINGYYNSQISIKSNKTGYNETITEIHIKPGKPATIKNINIYIIDNNTYKSPIYKTDYNSKPVPNNQDKPTKEIYGIVKTYKQQNKQIFNQDIYNKFKEDLLQSARNNGYLDARYTKHDVIINQDNQRTQINITLELNTIYYLNKVQVINKKSKHSSTDHLNITSEISDEFIFDFMSYDYTVTSKNNAIAINTPYKSQDILDLQNNLNSYLREVNIETNINAIDNTVDLLVKIVPLKNYLYQIGLGYNTDEGARTFGSLQIRNITPYGHKLDLKGKLAQYRDIAEVNYLFPGFMPATDFATIGYQFRSDKKRSNSNLEKERHKAIGQYQRILNNDNLELTGGISYRNEKYRDIANNSSRTSQLFVPYFIYNQILSPNRIKTYQGSHINIMLEAAKDGILSDTGFARLHTKLKSIIPLNFSRNITGFRGIVKGQFGQVWHEKKRKIPPTLRFFAGGSETVRGYRFESLGPVELNSKGKPIIVGGDRLVSASLELEKTVYKNLSAAAFYDIGNAMDTWDNWTNELNAGAGAGIRWQSPIGAVRFDVASALDKPGKPWRIDVNIGPDL